MSSKPKRRRTSKTLVSSQTPSTHGPLSNTQYSSPLPLQLSGNDRLATSITQSQDLVRKESKYQPEEKYNYGSSLSADSNITFGTLQAPGTCLNSLCMGNSEVS